MAPRVLDAHWWAVAGTYKTAHRTVIILRSMMMMIDDGYRHSFLPYVQVRSKTAIVNTTSRLRPADH
jgi:hypothetical protein